MIYSNDESDKSLRRKNHFFEIYVQPVGIVLIIAGVLYLVTKTHNFNVVDNALVYYLAFFLGFFMYARNKGNWLKMPDGTWHNIKDRQPDYHISSSEPADYQDDYFISKKEKIIALSMGVFMIAAGIFVGLSHKRGFLLPFLIILSGSALAYMGFRQLQDKSPQLRLASEGLWTGQLGFVPWKDISKVQVVLDTSGRSSQKILEIYLKGTLFAEAGKPDQRLNITALADNEYIETKIEDYIFRQKEVLQ